MSPKSSKVSNDVANKKESKLTTSKNNIKRPRKLNPLPTKIVIRHLPPTLTSEQFIEQVGPISDHNYYYYVKGDLSLGEHSYSRSYINFIDQKDILHFREKFDNYVFVDDKGNEYPAIVELALYQGVPKRRKKIDARCNTIENDPNFLQFIENKENKSEVNLPTVQDCLEEIEAKEKGAKTDQQNMSTPLLDYINNRKQIDSTKRDKSSRDDKRKDDSRRRRREQIKNNKSTTKNIGSGGREWQSAEMKLSSSNTVTIVKGSGGGGGGTSSSSKDNGSDLKQSTRKRFERRREDKKSDANYSKSTNKTDEKSSEENSRRHNDRKVIDTKNQNSSSKRSSSSNVLTDEASTSKNTFRVRILPNKERSIQEPIVDKQTGSSSNVKQEKRPSSKMSSGEKIRNKDRPSIQIYKPSPRSSNQSSKNDSNNKTSQERTSRH